eukprot:gene10755-2842_t
MTTETGQTFRINSVVGERIAAVLEDLLVRCELIPLVSCLGSSDTESRNQNLLQVVGNDARDLLHAHWDAERAHASSVNDHKQQKILRESTKRVLYYFSKHPRERKQVMALRHSPTSASYNNFVALLKQLSHLTYLRLSTSVEDQRSQHEKLNKLRANEKKNIVQIKSLQTKLHQAQREHEKEIKNRNHVISQLEDALDNITDTAAERCRHTLREARRKQDHHGTTAANDEKQLQERLENLTAELDRVQKQHREEEAKLRKRKLKLQAQIEGWIVKYDQDMGEKQRELDNINQQYAVEKKQLTELEENFTKLEIEYNQIMEERRQEREQKQFAEEGMQRLIRAAIVIQTCWRSYRSRKAARKAAAKKKKKSGKKKK